MSRTVFPASANEDLAIQLRMRGRPPGYTTVWEEIDDRLCKVGILANPTEQSATQLKWWIERCERDSGQQLR